MAGTLSQVKAEWHKFRDDRPGERFCNHRERAREHSRRHNIVSLALGVLLLAGGVVLLFIPGPGLLLIVFGLALVASHSRRLSEGLDRVEPKLRRSGRRMTRWWRARSHAQKIGLVIGALVIASAALMAIWKWVVAAYLL